MPPGELLPARLPPRDVSRIIEETAAKKRYIGDRLAILCGNTNPTNLWNSIVKFRHIHRSTSGGSNADDDAADQDAASYANLELTYEGYRAVAYDMLFAATLEENSEAEASVQEDRRMLYYSHPFLSPATFLGFSRSDRHTVSAVPLYAFVAKRLLLFRLRAELELVGSAEPPYMARLRKSNEERPSGGKAAITPCQPSVSSPFSNGLTQEDLETFIGDLLPHLRLIRDTPPWMLPYYLCHASRKFFFMCDTRRAGALSIDTIMKSEVFSELLRMFESDPRDAFVTYPPNCPVEVPATLLDAGAPREDTTPGVVVDFENDGCDASDVYSIQLVPPVEEGGALNSTEEPSVVKVRRSQVYFSSDAGEYLSPEQLNMDNWFSLPLMCRIYEHFTLLDQDEDGVLTVEELANYSNRSFTQLAIDRVFECHVAHSSGRHIMDYKTYLNFVIATEHAATRPAMKYIWDMLDLEGNSSQIKITTLHCFCKELAKELKDNGLMVEISAQSILSEIIDMINPEWHEWITFEDVVRSGQQATVLPILLSYRNFFAYDCREQTAAAGSDEYTEVTTT